ADAQIHPPLAGANVANPLQQLIEIVRDARTERILQPLVVHGEALHQVFAKAGGSPLAELRSPRTADAVADSENGFQTVVIDLAFDGTGALQTNYPEFPDSCPAVQLALIEDVDQMLVDRADVLVEQLRNLRLREPDRLVLEAALNPRPAIF